ncbi:MAG: 3-deoxy-7-phosphoheptulonate synthase [Symploca sp. SIO2G7]|nr:3-deoxy-7-phosphoheptulonate synthase [Symploca sp. SIO2G7]
MDAKNIFNINIESSQNLMHPLKIKNELPLTNSAAATVLRGRQEIKDILDGKDSRKFLIVGPCSIHDVQAAEEYARKLKKLSDQVKDHFLLVMRVYFEKPRTTVGWKGLINDPDLNDSFRIEKGLITARRLLIKIAEIGLPTATEALDPIAIGYFSELISWSAIGARTIESQTHREMASGLSMPVGLKNGTDGNVKVALDAMQASRNSHNFLGINETGQISIFKTKGNFYGHVILRGGISNTNFEPESIRAVEDKLQAAELPQRIVIDCSHGNSGKDHRLQGSVFTNVIRQIIAGNTSVVGLMLESNLKEGNQKMTRDLSQLQYGVSITDKCIGWEETENLILLNYEKLLAYQKNLNRVLVGC